MVTVPGGEDAGTWTEEVGALTWKDLHARTEILHEVLARAAADPANPGLFYGLPECDRLFGGPAGVLAALQYQWDNHMRAKLDQALVEGLTAADAYAELASEQPVLRAVLDAQDVRRWQDSRVLAS
ncbi:hypothetical protein BJY24_000605 [Nocardia transvalensis]|uniref:Uncharacterized protein n=1 Tax=Nocardia transvalensis TaxID=37333 RepID=A0A7W9P9N6_9NOCA|nr:hypothetical protein [Nocardia transvalensis]MBB5911738.1 hypothetical protein [Nocardia transvalensis]